MCASAAAVAAGSFAPRILIGSPPAAAEALARRTTHPAASSSSRSESEASHGKKVYFDYHVTGEVMTQIGDADIGTYFFLVWHTFFFFSRFIVRIITIRVVL